MSDKYKVISGSSSVIEGELNKLKEKWRIVHMVTTGMVASNSYGHQSVNLFSVVILEKDKEE